MALKNETPVLHPLPPEFLYMSQDDWEDTKKRLSLITITPFETDNSSQTAESMSFGAREGRNFTLTEIEKILIYLMYYLIILIL